MVQQIFSHKNKNVLSKCFLYFHTHTRKYICTGGYIAHEIPKIVPAQNYVELCDCILKN